MTPKTEMLFAAAEPCQICRVKFSQSEAKYRDHNHLKKQDNYRAALCNTCNFTYAKLPAKPCIKILFHSSCRYDMHFFIQELSKRKIDMAKIQIIPKNTECFFMLKFHIFQVLDTYEFLPAPLATLVRNLKEQGLDKFTHLKTITEDSVKHMEMLCSKQIYLNEYAQSYSDYDLPSLPPREEFVDNLAGKGPISELEYARAKEVKVQNFRWLHQTLCADRCALVGRRHGGSPAKDLERVWFGPPPFSHCITSWVECIPEKQGSTHATGKLDRQEDVWFLPKCGKGGVLQWFLNVTPGLITRWWNLDMTQENPTPSSWHWIALVFTAGPCASHYPTQVSSGSMG